MVCTTEQHKINHYVMSCVCRSCNNFSASTTNHSRSRSNNDDDDGTITQHCPCFCNLMCIEV